MSSMSFANPCALDEGHNAAILAYYVKMFPGLPVGVYPTFGEGHGGPGLSFTGAGAVKTGVVVDPILSLDTINVVPTGLSGQVLTVDEFVLAGASRDDVQGADGFKPDAGPETPPFPKFLHPRRVITSVKPTVAGNHGSLPIPEEGAPGRELTAITRRYVVVNKPNPAKDAFLSAFNAITFPADLGIALAAVGVFYTGYHVTFCTPLAITEDEAGAIAIPIDVVRGVSFVSGLTFILVGASGLALASEAIALPKNLLLSLLFPVQPVVEESGATFATEGSGASAKRVLKLKINPNAPIGAVDLVTWSWGGLQFHVFVKAVPVEPYPPII